MPSLFFALGVAPMLVLRMLVSPALPPSPTAVDTATRPAVQVLEIQGGGVVDGGLKARRRVPGGQDEAVPVAQVPRPHARRGRAPRDQLQEHRAAQCVSVIPDSPNQISPFFWTHTCRVI